jgi:hypothetical protein
MIIFEEAPALAGMSIRNPSIVHTPQTRLWLTLGSTPGSKNGRVFFLCVEQDWQSSMM